MTDERQLELLEAYADQALGEEEARELLAAFEADATLKARFVEELQLSNSLRGLGSLEDMDLIPTEVVGSLRSGKASPDVSEAVLSELLAEQKQKKIVAFPIARVVIGLAAVLAATLLVISQYRTASSDSLATLALAIDAQWSESALIAFQPGAELGTGRISLASGVVRLDFAKGVRVTLEGPAEFDLIAPGETRLHSGNLTAHVPPEGIGFQVHTARAEIIDLGTTFGVSVDKSGATDIAVFEGEIEVNPSNGSQGEIIGEGSSVLLATEADTIRVQEITPRTFRGWPILFGVVNTGGHIRFINAQPIENPAQVTDADNMVIFPERFSAKVKTDIDAGITAPGDYRPKDFIDHRETLVGANRRVNSYLIQYNPPHADQVPNSDQKQYTGDVTFDRPVVAIIVDTDQLIATDESLGKKRFEYPTHPSRALEHGDSISLSPDRRTLTVDWQVMQALERGMDQIRVLVEADADK